MKRTIMWKIIGKIREQDKPEDTGAKREVYLIGDTIPDPPLARAVLLDGLTTTNPHTAEVLSISFNLAPVVVAPESGPEDATREMSAVEPPARHHKPMSKGVLLEVLDDIRRSVAADDSLEGSIEYMMPSSVGLTREDADFAVMASYRTGNREGQGGVRLIRADTP